MELVKNIILLITTIICIDGFRKSPGQGVFQYLLIFSLCSLIGFSRGILEETIILPLCLLFCRKNEMYNPLWLLFIISTVLITFYKGNKVFGDYDEIMIAGFLFLAMRNSLFSEESHIYRILVAIWLFAQCKTLNLILMTGASAFSIADANDMSTRMLDTTTIYGTEGVIDPNYFSLVAGLGLIITFFIIINPEKFNFYIGYNCFGNKIFLGIILLFDLFFSLRGLSRGVFLAVIGAVVTFMYYKRVKLIYVALLAISALILFIFADHIPIIGGFIYRFEHDETGGGRFLIWAAMARVVFQDGPLSILFGEGLNSHWWTMDNTVSMGELLSSHNSIVTILFATGLVGAIIMTIVFSKAYVYARKNMTIESVYKIVLLTYILLGCMSIEPLHFIWAWIVLAFGCSKSIRPQQLAK